MKIKKTIFIPKGALWYSSYRNDTENSVGIFYFEGIGTFLTCGVNPSLPVDLIFKKALREGITLPIRSASLDHENNLILIKGKEGTLIDWKEIILALTKEKQDELLQKGLFFPVQECGDFWKSEEGGITIDITLFLNSIVEIKQLVHDIGEDYNWEELLTMFMFQFNQLTNEHNGLEVMKLKEEGFKTNDLLSVETFVKIFLNN